MLFSTPGLPMKQGGVPWGTIFVAAVFFGIIGYIGYQSMKEPVIVNHKKTIV